MNSTQNFCPCYPFNPWLVHLHAPCFLIEDKRLERLQERVRPGCGNGDSQLIDPEGPPAVRQVETKVDNGGAEAIQGRRQGAQAACGRVQPAERVQTGTIGVNMWTLDPAAPFGGHKASGLGKEFGPEGLDEYVNLTSLFLPDT